MKVPTATSIKRIRAELTAKYLGALRGHMKEPGAGNGDRAQGIGRAALTSGFVTRDLARMHEQALLVLASSFDFTTARHGSIKRAGYFFTQALKPLESAQRATRVTNQLLHQKNETLRLHTAALAKSNRRMEQEITRRKTAESVMRRGREEYQKLFLESQIMQRKLRHVTHQILSAQEEERKEISRELHDEVVQTLVGINVQLSALSKGLSIGLTSLKAKIARTQRLVEHSVNEVHRFARELRPAVLDDLGLIPALHAHSKSLAAREGLKIQLTAFGGIEALQIEKRTVLYRVALEALNNVVRHARASCVRIGITRVLGVIRMEVADDGTSFDVAKTLLARNNKRLGLIGMKERLEMIGGSLVIESLVNRGTTVRAELPFKPRPAQ